jgi:chromosome segregation ATPase
LQSQQLEANEELEAIRAELAEFEAAVTKAQQALELESEKVSKLQAAAQGAKANEKEVKTEVAGVLKEGKAAKGQLEKAEAAFERAVSRRGI